jgi:hypothetical protein
MRRSAVGRDPDQGGSGFGTLSFAATGLQNGNTSNNEPDGIALVNALGGVVEFISYEGAFTAASGPAAGLTSVDVGVVEPGNAAGTSIARTGTGSDSANFSFALATDDTPGAVNAGQTLQGGGTPPAAGVTVTLSPSHTNAGRGRGRSGDRLHLHRDSVGATTGELTLAFAVTGSGAAPATRRTSAARCRAGR